MIFNKVLVSSNTYRKVIEAVGQGAELPKVPFFCAEEIHWWLWSLTLKKSDQDKS